MYYNFIYHHFSNQAGIIVFVNRPCVHCGFFRLTTASSLWSDFPRTSPRNEAVKLYKRQMTLANSPVQWPSWTWCRIRWSHSCHSNLKPALFCLHSPRTPLVFWYHVISRTQSAAFGCSPSGLLRAAPIASFARGGLTVEQLRYSSDCMGSGRAAQIDAKTNFRFGNIVPKTMKIVGIPTAHQC